MGPVKTIRCCWCDESFFFFVWLFMLLYSNSPVKLTFEHVLKADYFAVVTSRDHLLKPAQMGIWHLQYQVERARSQKRENKKKKGVQF